MKDKIIMQCFIPDALRDEIEIQQTELRFKGVTKRASSISAIYTALVKKASNATTTWTQQSRCQRTRLATCY